MSRALAVLALASATVAMPSRTPQPSPCGGAAAFAATLSLRAIVDPDTLDDWRTRQRTPGCRVTAAGLTDIGIAREAVRFYERVRAAGWVRTPDPMDSPNESSLRFRRDDADCLFNVYAGPLLDTDAENTVSTAFTPRPGELVYHVLALCVPARPAAPR